ncbi:diguanylate cyclase/phosphodiesterase [Motilibacter rhizosphaerae]|uniref:Diguanylate cyclase/phosphodiesterase n=1 Tax=Motilibacter rhizosphaerae TaxID=598652 RepID=A0A4V2F3D8_9ACTN|nr:diguanylate cyclase/phosphodiesterase [Motilibacter rhizosphaerae]
MRAVLPACAAAALLSLGLGAAGPGAVPWVLDHRVLPVLMGLFALPATGALRSAPRRTWRRPLAGALLSWSVGYALWALPGRFAMGPVTPSDACFVLFYPLAGAGLWRLLRGQGRRVSAATVLDAVVAGLGAFSVITALALPVVGSPLRHLEPATLLNACYPVGDAVLLSVAASLLALRGAGDRRALLLTLTFALLTGADTTYATATAGGAAEASTWLVSALWALACVGVGSALLVRDCRQEDAPRETRVGAVPVVAALGALGVLLTASRVHVSVPALGLAVGALVAASLRGRLDLRSLQELVRTRRDAHLDDLTGLGNRRHLDARLQELLEAAGEETPLALLLVDLDRFKEVNDAYGPGAGDDLLQQVAARLVEAVPQAAALSRLGDDEFALALPTAAASGLGGPTEHLHAAQRIVAALAAPFEVAGAAMHVTASIGMSVAASGWTSTELVRTADVAMHEAKRASGDGSHYRLYDVTTDDSGLRLALGRDLRRAVEQREITLHYQPQLDIAGDRVVGMEALARWSRPGYGPVPPDVFVPLAEELGLMPALTELVVGEALRQCAEWRALGHDLRISVNITASGLLDPGLVEGLSGRLAGLGLPAEAVVLEITESTLMSDPARAREVIEQLRLLGVDVSVDDFGTGYSSLAYLRRLPVTEVKLDRAFVMGMLEDPIGPDAAIVRAASEMARALGLRVVAEGVEDVVLLGTLLRTGCALAQGYGIARPSPAGHALAAALAHEQRRSAAYAPAER